MKVLKDGCVALNSHDLDEIAFYLFEAANYFDSDDRSYYSERARDFAIKFKEIYRKNPYSYHRDDSQSDPIEFKPIKSIDSADFPF